MIFECKRCGHIETHKGNFLKHLNRKIACKPILKDIDIETLKHELEIKANKVNTEVNNFQLLVNNPVNNPVNKNTTKDNNILECRYCNKVFSHKQSKYLHESKYCKEKLKKQDELAQLKEQLAEKDEKLAKKDQILEERLAQKDLIIEERLAQKDLEIDFMKKQIELLMKKI